MKSRLIALALQTAVSAPGMNRAEAKPGNWILAACATISDALAAEAGRDFVRGAIKSAEK